MSAAAKILRLGAEIAGVARVCGTATAARFAGAALLSAPEVVRSGILQPADRRMQGSYRLRPSGIVIPCGEMDRLNPLHEDSPAFSAIRELFARDVYLRGFRALPRIVSMIDLGANRGVVSVIGAKLLGAGTVVGVEPVAGYAPCFDALADANGLTPGQRHRVAAFAGAEDGDGTVSVGGLMARFGIERIGLLKCDIEGGETAVILGDGSFLDRVDRIVMELHPDFGVPGQEIADRVARAGFAVSLADAAGDPAPAAVAEYLYAARDAGELSAAPMAEL